MVINVNTRPSVLGRSPTGFFVGAPPVDFLLGQ